MSDKDGLKAQLQGVESAINKLEVEYSKGMVDLGRYLRLKEEYETKKAKLQETTSSQVSDTSSRRGTKPVNLPELRKQITSCFDREELRTLCFDLYVDYDSLTAEGKEGKARELVSYFDRRGRISELIIKVSELRPDVSLNSIFHDPFFGTLFHQVSLGELRGLTLKIFGADESDDLVGNTRYEQVAALMERIHQFGKEAELAQVLAELRPEVSSLKREESLPTRPRSTKQESTLSMQFVNRESEWKTVVDPPGQYYLFEGPAGYGKTELLHKIGQELEKRKWLCVYISLQEQNTLQKFIGYIAQELQIKINGHIAPPRQIGEDLGLAIVRRREIKEFVGVALLLDVDREPWDPLIQVLRTIVEDIIPAIYRGLTRNSTYFQNTPANYRVVLAGRFLTSRTRQFKYMYEFDPTQLQPFNYTVARNMCKQYVKDDKKRDEFAANLLFFSGGHPNCIAQILQMFEKAGDTPDDFFDAHRDKIEHVSYQEANRVHASIEHNLREFFRIISVHRRLDYPLLKQYLDLVSWYYEDEYDLARKLLRSYLLGWAKDTRHLREGSTRRLLAVRLRYDISPALFQIICNEAKNRCMKRLQEAQELCPYWAVEVLFEYLQGNVAKIDRIKDRQSLRHQFLEVELPKVLGELVRGRDDPRSKQESLLDILEEDWEFNFTVNYYLRGDTYNDKPYQKVSECIKHFFDQHQPGDKRRQV